MKNPPLLCLLLLITTPFFGQQVTLHSSIEDYYENLFKVFKLETTLKFKDEKTNSTIYSIKGLENNFAQFSKNDNTEIVIILQTINSENTQREFITMDITFDLEKELNLKDKFEFINRWAKSDYPASVYWDEEAENYVLIVTEQIIGEGSTYHRLTDRFIGLIASYSQLKNENSLK